MARKRKTNILHTKKILRLKGRGLISPEQKRDYKMIRTWNYLVPPSSRQTVLLECFTMSNLHACACINHLNNSHIDYLNLKTKAFI